MRGVIHDVDESIKALIARDAANGSGVEVVFDAPTKDWAVRRTAPTIDVFLYDIREDLQRRDMVTRKVRDASGITTVRRAPPRRYRLSYLLTAWTQRPEDEHRLLARLMATFLRIDRVPHELLAGSLRDLDLPVIVDLALPRSEDRSLFDIWSALGGELKPSLDLQVIAPIDPMREVEVGPPVLEGVRVQGDRHPRAAAHAEDELVERLVCGDGQRPGRTFDVRRSARPGTQSPEP